jgi:DNA-binding transcriptional LysR family regulator
MAMDIRQLKNVLSVMETGSLNKASLQLRVSQPALTKSIQRLEALLGVPLFVREAKGMRATIYAETLRDFARATCVGLDQSMSEIHALKSGLSGTLSMCGPPLIAGHLFPAAIIRVTTDFPNLKIRIIEQIDNLFEALLDGKFDLLAATITSQASRYGLNCLSMFDEDLVVIARRGHPVTRIRSPTAKQLSKFKWVHSSPGNLHRQRLEQFFEMANVPFPRPIAETSSPALIRSVVLSSDCLALMAKMGAQPDLDAGVLDYIKINSPLMVRSIGLLWRSTHPLSAGTKHMINTLKLLCQELGHKPRLIEGN